MKNPLHLPAPCRALSLSALAGLLTLAAPAATRVRYLDPYTQLWQTDEASAGRACAAEPGYWPAPNGLVDPLAQKLAPRIIHSVYRQRATPFPDYDPAVPSALFKVNQVGYQPDQPKFAYLGAWLGPRLGAWRPHGELGAWRVVDAACGETVYAPGTPPVHRVADRTTKEGAPFTGEQTYEMDFSSVTNEGVYYVAVDGVGRSADFRIGRGAAEEAFRVHMGGLYQKRCGIAKTEPWTHWTAGACHTNVVRGVFAPEEGTLPKGVRWFDIIRQSTDWTGGERLTLAGGWHDAADYDRRPAHLAVVNDLCAAYLMRLGNFRDGQLAIPESANGIPDILDEAEWGLRHLRAGQQANGGVGTWIESTGHPVPGSDAARDTMPYALSRATRASSLAYAAHAALLARCHPAFRDAYLESARRAWTYALTAPRAEETFFVEKKKGFFSRTTEVIAWEEARTLPAQHLVKAAVNLHALTQDKAYLDALRGRWDETMADFRKNEWRWSAWVFAGERALGLPDAVAGLMREWDRKVLNRARDMRSQVDGAYAYRCPWWFPNMGWCHAMSWGQSHPLRRAQTLVLAYEMTGERANRDAAFAALDFHNGCNPQGTTLTSGLGTVYPVAFLDLPSYVDGIAEYVPGITPYRWTYGQPPKAVEWVYGGDKARATACPIWRRWGNLENQTVAASEYTVWETIAPAAAVCGYLMTPTDTPPPVRPRPADDLRALPGYWPIP